VDEEFGGGEALETWRGDGESRKCHTR
jgi:hypothetical protein